MLLECSVCASLKKISSTSSVTTSSMKHRIQCSLSPFDICCCQKNMQYLKFPAFLTDVTHPIVRNYFFFNFFSYKSTVFF